MKRFMIYDMQTDMEIEVVEAYSVNEAELNFLKNHSEYGSNDIYALTYVEEETDIQEEKEMLNQEMLNEIGTYMNDEVREWVHDCYMGCEPEEFLKQYYLRLIYEYGEEAGDEFEILLSCEFGINIMDYVSLSEKWDAIDMYENTDEYGTEI